MILHVLLAIVGAALGAATLRAGDVVRPTATAAAPALPTAKKKPAAPKVLHVGPGRDFIFPSVAAQFAGDGDTIEIEAGDYEDVTVWKQSNLTIRGVGGRPHVRAAGSSAEGKGVWVIKGKNVVVENVEISGAAVRDKNGSAIRAEGAGLILRKVYFHDNEQGLLTSHNRDSEVLIEESEFSRNGSGDGKTHNIYAGKIKSLTVRRSYIHHARIGHQIKSRAQRTSILYSRIMDEDQGASSYLIDISVGGVAYVIGNVLQHGPHAENYTSISYGAEGIEHPISGFYVINNTAVHERAGKGYFVSTKAAGHEVLIMNNVLSGGASVLNGEGVQQENVSVSRSDLVSPDGFDYRLKPGSKALRPGSKLGRAFDVDLVPREEYVHPASGRPRPPINPPDLGAFAISEKR